MPMLATDGWVGTVFNISNMWCEGRRTVGGCSVQQYRQELYSSLKRLVGRVSKVSSFVGFTRTAGCIQIIRM
jgi:hypothetical protein